jgi:hypothetical protein
MLAVPGIQDIGVIRVFASVKVLSVPCVDNIGIVGILTPVHMGVPGRCISRNKKRKKQTYCKY